MDRYTIDIIYDHRNRTEDGQEGPLEVRLTVKRKSYYINTGVRVTRKQWVGAVVNRPDMAALNERLGMIVQQITHEANMLQQAGLEIDAAVIKERVFGSERQEGEKAGLIKWVHEQVRSINVKDSTRKHFFLLEKRMNEFGKLRDWKDLTTARIYEWDAWLHGLKKPQSNGDVQASREAEYISDAAVYNHHKDLKSLLSRAVRIGKIEVNPYDRLRGAFKRSEKENLEYLTDEEMQAIVSLRPMAGTQIAMARDLFVCQMYTGLSYADTQAFNLADYKQVNGKWINVGARIKTGVSYVSQLLPPVIEVVERYGWEMPKINNAQYNLSLKVIQQALGIQTKLHSHLARHTFATWMLRNGVPIEHVSKMVGHASIKQTQRYAKVMPSAVYDDFERVAKSLGA